MSVESRYRRLRRLYLTAKGSKRPALRIYLQAKARTGRWDSRYCSYYDVSTNVSPSVKRFITRGYAMGLVPTSTRGGQHATESLHYSGRAADLGVRRNEVGKSIQMRRMRRFQASEYRNRSKHRHAELIGPINGLIILRGQTNPLPEGTSLEQAHDNHVHGAF
jgi:hypothetical protein